MRYRQLATEIRRGLLQMAGAIRRHQAVEPSTLGQALAEILEAAADGIKSRYNIGQHEGRR